MEQAANFCLASFCLRPEDILHAANFRLASYLRPEDMELTANFRLALLYYLQQQVHFFHGSSKC